MNASPLQLLTYVAEEIHLDLAPGFDPDAREAASESPVPDDFGVDIEPLAYARPGQRGDLRLTVRLNDGAETWPYFRARVVLRGRFELLDPNPPPPDELDKYFLVSAATVLYGIARALFTQFTSASPYPRLVLPIVTFGDEVDARLAQRNDAAYPPPKKRAARKPKATGSA